jgi:glycosyltransferase involved in cell wall biosynthesis
MSERSISALFYTLANLNLIDGSAIWMQSVAETLHTDPRIRLTIPLRAPERRDLITKLLRRMDRVELLDPTAFGSKDPAGMSVEESIRALGQLDAERHPEVALIRAYDLCLAAVERGLFRGRLWSCYVLEPEKDITSPAYLAGLARIAEASRYVVCQSEEMRALLESLVPAAIGKTIILAPAIPAETRTRPDPERIVRRLIYTGKFHRFYPVERMIEAFTALRADYPDLEFHVAGDKFHRPKGDAGYAMSLEHSLTHTPGVAWHGGIGRDDVEAMLVEGGVALSLWDFQHGPGMNNLVISTKLLDYCSVGLPVILNRTAAQEDVLGPDYPLFVSGFDEAPPLMRRLIVDAELYREAAVRCFEASRRFTYPVVYAGIAPYLERTIDESTPTAGERRRTVAVGIPEVKGLIEHLARFEVRSEAGRDSPVDVVIAGDEGDLSATGVDPRNTPDREAPPRRIVRSSAGRAAIESPDAYRDVHVVVVPDGSSGETLVASGLVPADRVVVIPPPVDDAQLARKKLPEAGFNIGVAGTPDDRQLAILVAMLERIRRSDERFQMIVRTSEPAREAPAIDGLSWEPDDGAAASWLRTIGFVAAAEPDPDQAHRMVEAMSSGAVPIVVAPAGASGGLADEWVVPNADAAAARVLGITYEGIGPSERERSRVTASAFAGLTTVRAAWTKLLE